MKVGEAIYKAQQAEAAEQEGGDGDDGGASGEAASEGGDEKVVDAEFEEVDEAKEDDSKKSA